MSFITVFTPTYNRRLLIERLFQSLKAQSLKNFEWLVIDDGSTDDTELFFSQLSNQGQQFSIRYIKQPNGGKHRAINKGISLAKGDLFFIVDSDDYLVSDAIAKIYSWQASLDQSHKWAGFSGLRGFSLAKNIGQRNNSAEFIDAKNSERSKFKLDGDKAEVYFTEVLRNYPFPEIPGETFISEEIVWNAIARDGYYIRWFNEIIYICDYLEGGLTADNTKDQRNPKGCFLWANGQLKTFPRNFRKRFLAVAIYYNAVKNTQSMKTTAIELSVFQSTVLMSHLLFSVYKKIFLQRDHK